MIQNTNSNTETQPENRTTSNGSVLRYRNKDYRFNDHVCMEMLIGVPVEGRTGRLVQVRKGCGQFGTDIYLVRLRDMSLMRFENVLMRHANDRNFEQAFYLHNNRQPPVIPHQEPFAEDSTEATYTLNDEYPETGFIIEKPSQPQTPGSFSMIVSTPNLQ